MKDQLVFDTTSAATILESDSVGAFIRSSDGTLITHTTDGSREAIDVYTELGQIEDSAHTSGDVGAMALAVRSDAGGSLVSTDGDYTPLSIDATGALRVNATVNVDSQSDKAEDSAHTSGHIGEYVLSVRMDDINGSNAALLAGTQGDYQSTFTDAKGALYTSITNDVIVSDLANTAILSAADTLLAAGTAEKVIASNLANRKFLFVYNNDNRKMYIGGSGVDKDNGFPVSPKSYLEFRAGPAIDVYYDSEKSGHGIRTLELS